MFPAAYSRGYFEWRLLVEAVAAGYMQLLLTSDTAAEKDGGYKQNLFSRGEGGGMR
jgi:hypothetical protein